MNGAKKLWNIIMAGMTLAWLFCVTACPAMAQNTRVFDQAGLFSAEEAVLLEEQIARIREDEGYDIVVVTTADAGGNSSCTYADDFYDEGGFGEGTDADGILFLIDMDNREIYLSTAGVMQRYLTDSRIEDVLDHAYDYVQQGEYAGAAMQALEDVSGWYHKGIPGNQYLYDEDTGKISRYHSIRWYEFLLAFLVAGFCGAGACGKVRREYAMQQERRQAAGFLMAYRANAGFQFRQQDDVLVNSFVSQQMIPRNTSGFRGGGRSGGFSGGGRSTVHRSSGGRSHGGGGRRF